MMSDLSKNGKNGRKNLQPRWKKRMSDLSREHEVGDVRPQKKVETSKKNQ